MNYETETDAQPQVAISIVNWNTPEQTLACLRAVRAATYTNVRVVVVDNASRDDSIARIRAEHPEVTVLANPRNAGYAGGHALAWNAARDWQADALWLLNADASPEPEALAQLVAAWRRFGDAIYGGVVLRTRGDGAALFDFPNKFFDPLATPATWQRDCDVVFDADWAAREPLRVGAVSGAAFFVPLRVVERHGWMDTAWFMYCEEIDYCYRLRERGVACRLVPQAKIWHVGGGSALGRAGVADALQYYHARNEIVLARRHASRGTALRFALKKLLRGTATLPLQPRRARNIFAGVWHGLRGIGGPRVSPDKFLPPARDAGRPSSTAC